MPKHNSAKDKATGLIFSQFNIALLSLFNIFALLRDMPFFQLQYIQYMHQGLTFVLLCVQPLMTIQGVTSIQVPSGFQPILSGLTVFKFLVLFFVCSIAKYKV